MTTKADFELRHTLYGRQGSMWEKQTDEPTRVRVRRIVKSAGNAATLAVADQIATGCVGAGDVLAEDEFSRFASGAYAVVGKHLNDYDHVSGALEDGTRLHIAYRSYVGTSTVRSIPTKLTDEFIELVDDEAGTLPTDRDWYLVPIPEGLVPLVIEGRDTDTYLVNGVDFTARDGYIAMTDDPSVTLPAGVVRVSSSYVKTSQPNSYAISTSGDRFGTRWVAEYTYKSGSLLAFEKAAAEAAGLYVFQSADIVLDAREVYSGAWSYTMAAAGVVVIDYAHEKLHRRQEVHPGYIVSNQFAVVASAYGSDVDRKANVAYDWGAPIELDGILPVNGLTWDGRSRVEMVVDPDDLSGGTPHLRPVFEGPTSVLERFWEMQRLHELATGNYLYDYLGQPPIPASVDFWELLDTFYGAQLLLILAGDHGPAITAKLRSFAYDQRPPSCNMLLSIKGPLPVGMLINELGQYVVDEPGRAYVMEGLRTICAPAPLAHDGDMLLLNGLTLSLPVCTTEGEEQICSPTRLTLSSSFLAVNGLHLSIATCEDVFEPPHGFVVVRDMDGNIVYDESGNPELEPI